ncbi:hypothetical protein ACWET9_01395 [Streptomyces sp. NPDC004059]
MAFVETGWYDWQALDELAVSASCCERLLEGGKLPDEHRERVTENLRFARQRLSPRELAEV